MAKMMKERYLSMMLLTENELIGGPAEADLQVIRVEF